MIRIANLSISENTVYPLCLMRWARDGHNFRHFDENDTETICEMILTFISPFDILASEEVRRSLVGLLDFKSDKVV